MAELPAASTGGFAAVLMVMVAGFAEAPGTVAGGPMAVANRLDDWAREAPRPNNNNSQCADTAKPITASACYAEETITSPAGAAMLHILQTTHLAHPSTCTLLFIAFCFLAERGEIRDDISQALVGLISNCQLSKPLARSLGVGVRGAVGAWC